MITLEKIHADIQELIDKCANPEIKPMVKSRHKNRIKELRQLDMYLRTYPTEKSLQEQLDKLLVQVQNYNDGFEDWKSKNRDLWEHVTDTNQIKTIYANLVGMKALKDRIETLNYLLQ